MGLPHNVAINSQHSNFLKAIDDRDVIRRHAFGYFPEILHASAKSAAMLAYLTNDTNVVGAPNENYARELMELHTLGIDGPYAETDVRELARCFTGWSYVGPNEPTNNFGAFRFNAADHDDGAKQVLGISIPAGGGVTDGKIMHDVLATHPSTARFLATKLLRWFVTYDPPTALVDRIAGVYLQSGGHIPTVLLHVLDDLSMAAHTPKFKQPFHFGVSLMRALGIDVADSIPAIWNMGALRQLPFDWPAPNGYPDSMDAWVGSMIPRWHFATQVCNTWWSFGTLTIDDLHELMNGAPRTSWAQRINEVLTGGEMTPFEIQAVQNHVDNVQWPNANDLGPAFEIAANSPTFQLY